MILAVAAAPCDAPRQFLDGTLEQYGSRRGDRWQFDRLVSEVVRVPVGAGELRRCEDRAIRRERSLADDDLRKSCLLYTSDAADE